MPSSLPKTDYLGIRPQFMTSTKMTDLFWQMSYADNANYENFKFIQGDNSISLKRADYIVDHGCYGYTMASKSMILPKVPHYNGMASVTLRAAMGLILGEIQSGWLNSHMSVGIISNPRWDYWNIDHPFINGDSFIGITSQCDVSTKNITNKIVVSVDAGVGKDNRQLIDCGAQVPYFMDQIYEATTTAPIVESLQHELTIAYSKDSNIRSVLPTWTINGIAQNTFDGIIKDAYLTLDKGVALTMNAWCSGYKDDGYDDFTFVMHWLDLIA